MCSAAAPRRQSPITESFSSLSNGQKYYALCGSNDRFLRVRYVITDEDVVKEYVRRLYYYVLRAQVSSVHGNQSNSSIHRRVVVVKR
jgi:hypothetical protein